MNDVYEELKTPAYPGQERSRKWGYLIRPTSPYDEMWVKRAREYWERQEKRFGIEFAAFQMELREEEGAIATYAIVRRLKPGKRVPQRQHEAPLLAQ